jgi:SAM-dependent methyltransferase
MGISTTGFKILLFAKNNGVSFNRSLMLGRQHFFAKQELTSANDLPGANEVLRQITHENPFSEPFFKALGAEVIDSMDFSDYEGATLIHDLNRPIPESLYNRYDVVFDGGTLEHVFNFPQAIKNAMQMVKPGGHFIGITPANNQLGHGFYQFSPELFYRIFAKENGFEVVRLFINTSTPEGKTGAWYLVKDPHEVHERVLLTNSSETNMMIIARKNADVQIFSNTPQQSDYADTWEKKDTEESNAEQTNSSAKGLYQKIIPASVRHHIWKLRYKLKNKQVKSNDLGTYKPSHFTRFN